MTIYLTLNPNPNPNPDPDPNSDLDPDIFCSHHVKSTSPNPSNPAILVTLVALVTLLYRHAARGRINNPRELNAATKFQS